MKINFILIIIWLLLVCAIIYTAENHIKTNSIVNIFFTLWFLTTYIYALLSILIKKK